MSERIPDAPPIIKPVDKNIQRPLWSVMIPTYNCAKYLTKTLQTVLSQDPGASKMQIEVIDDCSKDNVKAVVDEIGKGRVDFFKQQKNLGSLRNFETCLNRSRGKYIHLLHGDDFIDEGFYTTIENLFQQFPQAGAVCTGFWHVDDKGACLYPNDPIADRPCILQDWLITLAKGQKLQPPSVVVKREVYEKLGSFFGMHYGEDWEMWVRIAAHYPFAYSPEKLANYRIHDDGNITTLSFRTGQHIRDIEKAINLIQPYLPEDKRKELKKAARKNYSFYYASTSDMVYHRYHDPEQAIRQAKMALKMDVNFTTMFFLLKMYLKKIIKYKNADFKA